MLASSRVSAKKACKITTKIWNTQDFEAKNQIYLNFFYDNTKKSAFCVQIS